MYTYNIYLKHRLYITEFALLPKTNFAFFMYSGNPVRGCFFLSDLASRKIELQSSTTHVIVLSLWFYFYFFIAQIYYLLFLIVCTFVVFFHIFCGMHYSRLIPSAVYGLKTSALPRSSLDIQNLRPYVRSTEYLF